jgi:hypothetical protein
MASNKIAPESDESLIVTFNSTTEFLGTEHQSVPRAHVSPTMKRGFSQKCSLQCPLLFSEAMLTVAKLIACAQICLSGITFTRCMGLHKTKQEKISKAFAAPLRSKNRSPICHYHLRLHYLEDIRAHLQGFSQPATKISVHPLYSKVWDTVDCFDLHPKFVQNCG